MKIKLSIAIVVFSISTANSQLLLKYTLKNSTDTVLFKINSEDPYKIHHNFLFTDFPSFSLYAGGEEGFPLSLNYTRIFEKKYQFHFVASFPIVDEGYEKPMANQNFKPFIRAKFFEFTTTKELFSKEKTKKRKLYLPAISKDGSVTLPAGYDYVVFEIPQVTYNSFDFRSGANFFTESIFLSGIKIGDREVNAVKEANIFAGIGHTRSFYRDVETMGYKAKGFSFSTFYFDVFYSPYLMVYIFSDSTNTAIKFESINKFSNDINFRPFGYRFGFRYWGRGTIKNKDEMPKILFLRSFEFEIGVFPYYANSLYFNIKLPMGISFK